MNNLLNRFKIFHQNLDPEGSILPSAPEFWRYLDLPMPECPVPVSEVFLEVVGRENEILEIMKSAGGELSIPAIARTASRTGYRYYFNLFILPDLVILEDQTPVMETQRKVVQRNNEITLLKQDLEKQNLELSSANDKLDILGKTLLEKNEELIRLLNLIRAQNHDLESKVMIRTRELQDSRLVVIMTLARAAEFRDLGTGDHIYRIGRSCVQLGRETGLSAGECEMLFHASLLHDVGKIGIPDSILLKPGALTPREWETMKSHTLKGSELLGQDDFILFRLAREIARFHHEKWDGTGYPEGLKGGEIPVMSRICAIADMFDALMTRRPYKEAWSLDRSVEEIRKESGKSFDPDIVAAFMKVLDDIVRLRLDPEGIENLMPEFV